MELVHTTWNQVISFAAGTGEALWSLDIPTEQIVASMAREKDLLVVGGGTSGPNANVVMRLADAAGSAPETLWTSTKGTPEDASPVLYDGRLFTVTDAGILSCFDVLSGKMLWRRRLQAGTYYSSLLVANGKLFASNRAGETTVLTADEEGRVLSVNKLEDGLSASPAVAGNCLLLRTREYLYCIEASGND